MINEFPCSSLLDCCKFLKDGQVPFVMLRPSQRFAERGGIREVKISLFSSIGEVGVIEYKACNGRCHSIRKEGAIDKVLICICNCFFVVSMGPKIIGVVV